MKCVCKQCGKEFELTQSEIDFYNGKNLSLPKRCEACRAQNKKQKKAKAAVARKAGGAGKSNYAGKSNSVKPYNAAKKPSAQVAEKTDVAEKAGTSVSGAKQKKSSKAVQMIKLVLILLIIGLVLYSAFKNKDAGDDTADNYSTEQEYAGSPEESLQDVSESAQNDVVDNVQNVTTENAEQESREVVTEDEAESTELDLYFRNESLLESHYEKHGKDMGFASAKEYEAAAAKVVMSSETLHKIEAEDGDDVYYLESTNEFVVVSKDGYIRTYFLPDAGIDYYNRQ